MFSGLISTQDQLYAYYLRLACEHSPMVVVMMLTMLFGNWLMFWQTLMRSRAAPKWSLILTSRLAS